MEMEAYALGYGYTWGRVEEEEGISKVPVQTVIEHHDLISCPRLSLHLLLSLEKLERGGRTKKHSIKGME